MPQPRCEVLKQPIPLNPNIITGQWEIVQESLSALSESSQNTMLLGKLPETYYIKLEMKLSGAKQAGIVLNTNDELKNGYYLYLDLEKNRFVYRSWLRMYEEGGKTFPYDVELETSVKQSADGTYELELLVEESTAVIYINHEAALSFRMYDYQQGQWGIFALGRCKFSKISGMSAID
jgi:beta-fructofuranosidase